MPEWIRGDVLDVRFAVLQWKNTQATLNTQALVTHVSYLSADLDYICADMSHRRPVV